MQTVEIRDEARAWLKGKDILIVRWDPIRAARLLVLMENVDGFPIATSSIEKATESVARTDRAVNLVIIGNDPLITEAGSILRGGGVGLVRRWREAGVKVPVVIISPSYDPLIIHQVYELTPPVDLVFEPSPYVSPSTEDLILRACINVLGDPLFNGCDPRRL